MTRSRFTALVGAGVLLFQLGWILAIPAFGGIDEFDHAYRAASVARGHISPRLVPNTDGPGDLIPVPADMVLAAQDRCSILPYTRYLNCHAADVPNQKGEVRVASTAARYNPVYPLLVGLPARPFTGSTALYVMRIVTVLICDALLLVAWLLAGRVSTTLWPRIGLLVAVTPVLLYATANAGPNGVQMCAGVLTWTAGIALSRTESQRSTVWSFAIALMLLLTVHATGPMWAFAIVACLAIWPGSISGVKRVWGVHRRTFVSVFVLTGLVAAGDLYWSLSHSTNLDWGQEQGASLRMSLLAKTLPLWVFQTIGSIPFRDQPVPVPVFAIALGSFGALIYFATRQASRRELIVLAAICVLFFVVPSILSVASFRSLGLAWQGRYCLPFACGLPLLAGWVLERTDPRTALAHVLRAFAPLAFCLTQAIAIWGVVDHQRSGWPDANSLGAPPSWLVVTLALLASALIGVGFLRFGAQERALARDETPALGDAVYTP